ncbi:MAG: 1-acyl-sn-glycerol-3-phosphate acyltransferase [Spirochaetales bacterium]|nr:1-acyl-sn-glycerol-3-phosphate acyltransferase [Spirochaetales bacterium]
MEKQDSKITILPESRMFYFFSRIVFSIVFLFQLIVYPLLFSFRIKGRSNLKGIRNAVFVSNHCHYLDPGFVAAAIWPNKVYFTGLEKTFRIPGLSFFVRLLRSLPIPENNPGEIIRPIGKLLRSPSSYSIHFFPEGEMLNGTQKLRPFMPGAFAIARFFNIPIIPIVEIQIKRKFFPSKIIMHIEEPVYASLFIDCNSKKEKCEAAANHVYIIMAKRLNLYR